MSKHSDEAEEVAAAWDARLRGAQATFDDRRAFEAWLNEDAEHESAHVRLQAALSTLRAHVDLPELSALRDEARHAVRANRRRKFAGGFALAAAAAAMVVLFQSIETGRSPEIAAAAPNVVSYVTEPDQRADVTLGDGSVVTLDFGTTIEARLEKSRRNITLLAGHALFRVAKDHSRPFIVKAGDRTITALGTVFDVSVSPREVRVTLAEGKVAVRSLRSGRGATPQILKPNQQFVAPAGAGVPQLRIVDTRRELSWSDSLFFEDEPLGEAIKQVNLLEQTQIVVDPEVRDLRINGMFHTGNTAGFVAALEMALPVTAKDDGNGRIVVYRRPATATQ